jgi:hypothetical protein
MCTTVKNRGIMIALLYTEYLPLPTNDWYNTWISPFQSTLASNMQSCASPGLYFEITTDGDITAAMQTVPAGHCDRPPEPVSLPQGATLIFTLAIFREA